MADPLLLAHQVAPLQFEIGGAWSPVSIRDQMVRGHEIVRRALRVGLIDTGARSLLVVGAGAAGATAALEASRLGVQTTLVEISAKPFERQALCFSRWIDPTQYDWPLDHWSSGRYPFAPMRVPLPWRAARANTLALAWRVRFRPSALLSVHYGTSPVSVVPAGLRVTVGFTGSSISTGRFGMMISAVGFGSERCSVPNNFTGWSFWDTDPFESANIGLPKTVAPKALISGAGDGALQDFLRLTTGKRSAAEILANIPSLPLPQVELMLATAEDHAARALAWSDNLRDDHQILSTLQAAHLGAVASALGVRAVSSELDILLPPDRQNVQLSFGCTHFSRVYSLNRFLVLLIAEHLRSKGKDPLLAGSRLVKVTSAVTGHKCGNIPRDCHGIDHEADFDTAPSCHSTAGFSMGTLFAYNVIVIRHGITPPRHVYGKAPAGTMRQLLPYYPLV